MASALNAYQISSKGKDYLESANVTVNWTNYNFMKSDPTISSFTDLFEATVNNFSQLNNVGENVR